MHDACFSRITFFLQKKVTSFVDKLQAKLGQAFKQARLKLEKEEAYNRS